MSKQVSKKKTEFTEEEIQTALNNLNKGVQFVTVMEAAADYKKRLHDFLERLGEKLEEEKVDLSDDLTDDIDAELMD